MTLKNTIQQGLASLCLITTITAQNFTNPLKEAVNDRAIVKYIEKNNGISKKESPFLNQLNRVQTAEASLPKSTEFKITQDNVYEYMATRTLVIGDNYYCGNCDQPHSANSGAFLISPDGLAITNYHVISSLHANVQAFLHDGTPLKIKEVLAADEYADLALFRVEAHPQNKKYDFFPIAPETKTAQAIHCLSHPGGNNYSYSTGHITRNYISDLMGEDRPWISVSAEYGVGSSGSPIINNKGQIVGVVSSTHPIMASGIDSGSLKMNNAQGSYQMSIRHCSAASQIKKLFGKKNKVLPKIEPLKDWTTDFQKTLKEAETNNKPTLLYFSSKHCMPCVKMQKEAFTRKDIHKILKTYNLIYLNMDKETYQKFSKEYKMNITSMPTLLVWNKDKKLVNKLEGYSSANGLKSFLIQSKMNFKAGKLYQAKKTKKTTDKKENVSNSEASNEDLSQFVQEQMTKGVSFDEIKKEAKKRFGVELSFE